MKSFGYYVRSRPNSALFGAVVDDAEDRMPFENFANCAGLELVEVAHDLTTGPRAALTALLETAAPGDVLLLRSLNDIVAASADDWTALREAARLGTIRIVALDVPETHLHADPAAPGEAVAVIANAILAAIEATTRAVLADRRNRQRVGIDDALARGVYRKPKDDAKRQRVRAVLSEGATIKKAVEMTGASAWLVQAVKREVELERD